jgi:hypothetical protein
MYGFPRDIDLSFFCGKELIQVSVGIYDVQLHFHESVSLSIQNRIEHTSKGIITVWEQEETPPISASSLLTLLGSCVVSAHGVSDGTLTLQFANGDIVKVFDAEGYESYQINNNGELIIV